MNETLTLDDVGRLVQKICNAYGRPFGANAQGLITIWYDHLMEFPAGAVREAVDAWIAKEPRFPTVAGLRTLARARAPKPDAQRQGAPDLGYTCPDCRTPETYREWFVPRKTRSDGRAAAAIITREDGTEIPYVKAHRWLCDCAWKRQLVYLDADGRALTENPPVEPEPAIAED